MWPDVNVNDITERWRPLTPEEQASATQRLADAQAEINTGLRLRGLAGTPQFATTDELHDWETLYVSTVVAAVRRYFLNPEGWLEERESIDDHDFTRRRDSVVSTGALYFTDQDIDRLVPRKRRSRGAFTIRLGQS